MSITRMSVKVCLDNIGIIQGDEKRFLETYGFDCFDQRKSYDEYYINRNQREHMLNIDDLIDMSNYFKVSVNFDAVYLEEKQHERRIERTSRKSEKVNRITRVFAGASLENMDW